MLALGPCLPGGWMPNQNQPVNVYSYPGQLLVMNQGSYGVPQFPPQPVGAYQNPVPSLFMKQGWMPNQNQPVYSYPVQLPVMNQGGMNGGPTIPFFPSTNPVLPSLTSGGMNGEPMVPKFPSTDLVLPSPTSGSMNREPMIPHFPSTNSVLPPQISGFNSGTANSMMASFVKVNGDDNKITIPKNQSRCKCMDADLDPKKPGNCLKCGGNLNGGLGNFVYIDVHGHNNKITFQ